MTGIRRVQVATYNIHRCVGIDGIRDAKRVAAVIGETGADVIALQEVEGGPDREGSLPHLALLARETGFTAVAGPTLQDHRGDYGNAILTRYPVLSRQQIDLSVPGREPRGALSVDLDLGDGVVRVVGTHLGLRGRERRLQVERLLDAVTPAEHGLVVLGDFNEWLPRSPALRRLRERFGWMSSPRTFPSWRPVLPLDRIWGDPPGLIGEVRIHVSNLARVASDHLPVVAVVSA